MGHCLRIKKDPLREQMTAELNDDGPWKGLIWGDVSVWNINRDNVLTLVAGRGGGNLVSRRGLRIRERCHLNSPMNEESWPVLCVGLVCVDIINLCSQYPCEDTDQRCQSQRWQMGGNAANNCTVLSLLGRQTEFLGTIAQSHELSFLKSAFHKYDIDNSHCVYYEDCHTPVSIAIINEQNGSRTILHSNKDLPELTLKDFQTAVDLNKYKWIHFEGRPLADEIQKMLQHIEDYNTKVTTPDDRIITSVEIEKMRPQLTKLFGMADYVFVSKDHAHFQGYDSKEVATAALVKLCRPGATLICPWGEDGAIATVQDGATCTTPIFAPVKVVDTLGAGDTFVASTILSLSSGHTLHEAIIFGSKVAGAKCGMQGFDGLHEVFNKI
ncbi:Ketohexokinase [Lamellibrachia satsuma]|nr:Ketohexokinase [Lamellibrachia satsuma]